MSKVKQKRKINLALRRKKRKRMGKIVRFNLANAPTKFKGIKNCYAYQSNMHNLIFKDASFENVNYRASIITNCNFRYAKLTGVDFIYTNLKKTNFKNAVFTDCIFFGAKLNDADFENAIFNNVTFINTNIENAKNISIENSEVTILNNYPMLILDGNLLNILLNLATDNEVYKYHTLHVTRKKINMWIIHLLLIDYSPDSLARGLKALAKRNNKKNFYTVYSIRRFLNVYLKRGS